MRKDKIIENVVLEKLVHGGQCLGQLSDGKKIFVWGGLPREVVHVRITKKKSNYLEGIVSEIVTPSNDRVEARDVRTYLSSSPWQIMTYELENLSKQSILEEAFKREHIEVSFKEFVFDDRQFEYRNKVELGFWGDDDGLHYASYVRGSHGKQIIKTHVLAHTSINAALKPFLDELSRFIAFHGMRAGDIKTVLFRCSQKGEVAAALFLKKKVDCNNFVLPRGLQGLDIYYSNPKSPASIPTQKLHSLGNTVLEDRIMNQSIRYGVLSFFQVNIPVFTLALADIVQHSKDLPVIDMYAGVGTIGVCLDDTDMLVENADENIELAKQNAVSKNIKVVHAPSEAALDYIDDSHCLVLDPPRAGLHGAVVDKILEVRPPIIVYLSCNPSTQARDVALLLDGYRITEAKGYNFFPRTPHIESLVVLERL